jgi:hypothetical protein
VFVMGEERASPVPITTTEMYYIHISSSEAEAFAPRRQHAAPVQERTGGGGASPEAEGTQEVRGLIAGPLGDGDIGTLTTEDGGTSGGEEGDEGEASSVGTAWVRDLGEMGDETVGEKECYEFSSIKKGLL